MNFGLFRIAILLLAGITGCQRTLYDWGSYERSVFNMYSSREDFSVAAETDRLQKEVERTERKKYAIPPGKMAHLGYLYLMAGDSERARACFEKERELFPEGEMFMEFLLGRLQG